LSFLSLFFLFLLIYSYVQPSLCLSYKSIFVQIGGVELELLMIDE
jgi:hypothetical protein